MGTHTQADAACFNLLDERWIPVLYADGRFERVGIRTALEEAAAIREVRDSSPLVTFGVHRLLISVLKWLCGLASCGCPAHSRGVSDLPQEALALLKDPDVQQMFAIFAGRRIFEHGEATSADAAAQAPLDIDQLTPAQGKQSNKKIKTAGYLATEVPTETYKAHFWHTDDSTTRLCMACCVCGLVTLPPFCTGVGQGNETSINNVPPVYWLVQGERLLDTLLLNLPDGSIAADAPCWAGGRADEIGPLEGMTWQPRQVAVYPDAPDGRRCSRCGERGTTMNPLVRHIFFTNREGKKTSDARLTRWLDPHVAGAFEKKKDQTRFAGLAADVTPGAWCERLRCLLMPSEQGKRRQAPNVEALASAAGGGGRCEAVAYMLCSNKADFEHWQEERWPMSGRLAGDAGVRDTILEAAKNAQTIIASVAEEWPKRLWKWRYPNRRLDKNASKALKTGAAAAAIRSAMAEFDERLQAWFREQMCSIIDGQPCDLPAGLPSMCREAGHQVLGRVTASLSPAGSALSRAQTEHLCASLIDELIGKMEARATKRRRAKT